MKLLSIYKECTEKIKKICLFSKKIYVTVFSAVLVCDFHRI